MLHVILFMINTYMYIYNIWKTVRNDSFVFMRTLSFFSRLLSYLMLFYKRREHFLKFNFLILIQNTVYVPSSGSDVLRRDSCQSTLTYIVQLTINDSRRIIHILYWFKVNNIKIYYWIILLTSAQGGNVFQI